MQSRDESDLYSVVAFTKFLALSHPDNEARSKPQRPEKDIYPLS